MEIKGASTGGRRKRWQAWLERRLLVRNPESDARLRGRLLAAILLGMLLIGLIISILNFIEIYTEPGQGYDLFALEDLVLLVALAGLYWLNRSGRVRLAAFIFLILITLVIIIFDPPDTLDRMLLAYAIPIAAASFLIGPGYSFLFALLAAAGYTGVYLIVPVGISYNYLSMAVLFVFALVSALIAGQMDGLLQEARLALKRYQDAQSALRDTEARYRILVETSPDAIMLTNLEGNILMGNRQNAALFGFENPEALTGMNALDFFQPEDRPRAAGNMQRTLKDGTLKDIEYSLMRRDGSCFPAELSASLIPDAAGAPQYLMAIFRDITERKQAEETQKRNEDLFRALFELSPDSVVLLDPHDPDVSWPIVDCNTIACQMNGYGRDELIGHSIDILNLTPGAPAERIAYMEQLQETGSLKLETQHRHKSGVMFPVEVSTTLIKVGDRELVLGIDRDITERKRAEQELKVFSGHLEEMVEERTRELREAQEKLVRQERLATLGQLAGSVGHELRNPLGVISNAIYFLKMIQPDANATILKYLDIIEKETRTSDKIVTDLLDFTRLKSVDREPVQVSDLLRQTLERYPVPATLKVGIELPADLPPVYVDLRQVVQVLGNLVTNACQAMPEVGRLSLSASLQGDMMGIAVQDTGVGISPENMGKLFEPLFTTKIKGIGLGLAVSQKLVEANGGRIEVQSELGKGSTFTVYLPVFRS